MWTSPPSPLGMSCAHAFAAKHRIPQVHSTYEELLADPSIDAVDNPTPNGLHGRRTLAALAAGKHVLCEKPFTANASEARAVADAADASGLVVMEAFHYRYHPFARRMEELLASGELGEVRHVEAAVCFPLPRFKDIRCDLRLAGGATMDAGCYAVHLARLLGGATPTGRRHACGGVRPRQAALPRRRPRDDGVTRVPVRRDGPGAVLAVVLGRAADQRAGAVQPR
ncbi:Gfo/Idh/MocA family protein [Amycolatopsis sp. FDAARGOS 1241]|uniref:Gfo/Idh/MocA family protein n=1 Tax=Amycolatopsis sp. FDAARGOS 1241 TaxID=2778070 RepID=UPI001EF3D51C|nr:Gfo/Idh/MocA family oxidoreductase [Amycolatopsis sp. FDAARGOS 1241]